MGDETVAAASVPVEGYPQNGSGGPQATEQTPQNLTRDQVDAMLAEHTAKLTNQFQTIAKEFGSRGAQAQVDKARLKERVGAIERQIDQMVQDGALDEKQASTYKRQARADTLAEMTFEEPEQGQPSSQAQWQQRALEIVAEAGLTPQDPEYQEIGGRTPMEWGMSVERLRLKKQARLAAQTQTPQTPVAPAVPAPNAGTKPPVTTAMETGAAGTPPGNLQTLHSQAVDAARRGDFIEARRLTAEMQKVSTPSP